MKLEQQAASCTLKADRDSWPRITFMWLFDLKGKDGSINRSVVSEGQSEETFFQIEMFCLLARKKNCATEWATFNATCSVWTGRANPSTGVLFNSNIVKIVQERKEPETIKTRAESFTRLKGTHVSLDVSCWHVRSLYMWWGLCPLWHIWCNIYKPNCNLTQVEKTMRADTDPNGLSFNWGCIR